MRTESNCQVLMAVAAVAVGVSLMASSAHAANGTWTGGAGTTAWATAGNWSGGVPGSGNTATFSAAAGAGGSTINLGAGVTVSTLLFDTSNAAAYTIGSGAVGSQTLTLNNPLVVNNNSGNVGNISTGAVTMNSTVANDQTINAGIRVGGDVNYATNFTFTNNSTTNTLTFAGNITAGNSNTAAMTRTLFAGGAGNITVSGILANGTNETLRLAKIGAGTVTLTGANTYTNTTFMNGGEGTLRIGDGTIGRLNGTTGTALSFNGSGTVNFNEAAGSSQGMGVLTFGGGDGTLQSTYTGTLGTDVTTLTFTSMAGRTAGATRNFVVSGGTNGTDNKIVLTGVAAGFMDQASFFGGDNYAWMDGAGTYVRGLNWGTDGGSTTTAGGTSLATTSYAQTTADVTAQATATFTALNIVNTANSAQAFTLASGQTVTTNGVLRSGNGGANSVTTISGGTGIKAASNGELVIRTDQAGDLLTISTPILANGSSSLNKSGTGTLKLTATNTYTGATSLNGGALILANSSGLSSGGLNYNGGNLVFDSSIASHAQTTAFLASGSPNVNLSLQDNAGTAITLTINGSTSTTYNGVFSGVGSVSKTGSSTLTLTNNSTFSGGFTLASGILAIYPSATNALGSGTLTITGGSIGNNYDQGPMTVPNRQAWNGDFNVRTSSNSQYATGDVTLGGNRTIGANSWYTAAWSGVISDGGSNYGLTLVHNGYGGTFALSGANTFGGGLTVRSAGGNATKTTFQIGNLGTSSSASALGTGTFTIGPVNSGAAPIWITNTAGAGTLQTNNAMVWNSDFTFTGSNSLNFGTGSVNLGTAAGTTRTLTVDTGLTLTVGGVISNGTTATALTKAGVGTLVLSGASTYSGNTVVNDGTLTLASTGSILLDINDGGVSNQITGDTAGVNTLNLNGTLKLDVSGVTAAGNWTLVDVTRLAETFGGTFGLALASNNAPFVAQGSGVWALTDAGKTWTFTQSDGVLAVTIPEPAALLIAGMGGLTMLSLRRRRVA